MYAVDLIQNKVVYEFGGRDYFPDGQIGMLLIPAL